MFGVGEGPLGFEKFLGDADLLPIGEDEAYGGAEEGSADGDPGKGKLINRDSAPHEEDEQGEHHGKAVGDGEIAKTGDRFGDGIPAAALPNDCEINHGQIGKEEEKISPAGGAERGFQGEEKIGIGEDGEQKHEEESKRKRAKAQGGGLAGAEKEAGGEGRVTNDIEDKDLTGEVQGIGEPARRSIEKVEIGGEGEDGDLREIEDAEPIPAAGFFVGDREEHHEDRSGPDEEENVRGHRHLRGAGNEALVVGGDGLGKSFEV